MVTGELTPSLAAEVARRLRKRPWKGAPILTECEDGRLLDVHGRAYTCDGKGHILDPDGFPLPEAPEGAVSVVIVCRPGAPR